MSEKLFEGIAAMRAAYPLLDRHAPREAEHLPQCQARRWGARCVRTHGHAAQEHAGVLNGRLVTWVDGPTCLEVHRG